MSHPLVVHNKRSEYDIPAWRPRYWGNKFVMGVDGDRSAVIAKHRQFRLQRPYMIDKARKELRGAILGCWCAPKDCHCDFLAEVSATDPVPHEMSPCTCGEYGCQFCDGGLFACDHCNGGEGSLTSECPKTTYDGDKVYKGELNYIAGEWVAGSFTESGERNMPFWCGTVHCVTLEAKPK